MSMTQRADAPGRMLGYGGLLLAITGAIAITTLGGNTGIAIGLLGPLLVTGILAALSSMRSVSVIWLVTAVWTGMTGVLSIFSVGVIFLVATVLLLAAFVRANW